MPEFICSAPGHRERTIRAPTLEEAIVEYTAKWSKAERQRQVVTAAPLTGDSVIEWPEASNEGAPDA